MRLIIIILEIASPLLALLLTIITYIKAKRVKKMKEQTLNAQKRVEVIEKSIIEVKNQIANNNRISQITEMKEKTANFQKMIYKYLKNPKEIKGLGYSLGHDNEEINLYITYLKEHNWIFENESENYADNLYNELIPLANIFIQEVNWRNIHQQVTMVKPRFEYFKSKINKMHNESMLL